MSRNIVCLGGSFNPIHYGHLLTAASVAQQMNFSNVTLMPSKPWQKENETLAPSTDRLKMCELAIQDTQNLFSVSSLEIDREGPSYTLDTVKHYIRYGFVVNLIVGADQVLNFGSWHGRDDLIKLCINGHCRFIVGERPGYVINKCLYNTEVFKFIKTPLFEASSTRIREMIKEGKPLSYLVPEPVAQWIKERGLYK